MQYMSSILVSVACVFLTTSSLFSEENSERPNIMVYIADDMTWRDCEPYGNPDIITPNIQRLADEGVCFDNMFTATAMCAPTRQQLYTGLFPARSGAYPNHSKVYPGVKSLGHHFGGAGYRVALIGKRHYGPEEAFPFEYLGGRAHDNGKDGPEKRLEAILPIINGDDPFFLIVANNQPHTPWNRGDPSPYDPDALTIPDYMIDCEATRKGLPPYYGEITYMDANLGRCLDMLEAAGKAENTIVIFTSEQGYTWPFGKWTCYDLGLKTAFIARWPGKIAPGTRSVAMTQYVDVVPTLLEAVGIAPHQLDVGIPDTFGYRGFDGASFLEVLLGQEDTHRDHVFGIHTTRGIYHGSESYPIRAIRSGRYKYIRNASFESAFANLVTINPKSMYYSWLDATVGTPKEAWVRSYERRPFEELYDLEADPWEQRNLIDSKALASVRDDLRRRLNQWMLQQGDLEVATEMQAEERMGRK